MPEEAPPEHAVHCERCELHRQRTRVIWGEGNPEAPVLVLLDNPGAREDKEGNPFVCGTRETLQMGAAAVGIDLSLLYVTYLLKCRPIRAYNKEAARAACSVHLREQLEGKRPKLLFILGNVAVQSFFQNPEAEVKHMRGRWHETGGFPVAVSYHPLAVRRRPVLFPHFVSDFRLVAERL
nr:uracil-DNA glycosylase [Paenibacillus hamazuiensis]